MISFYNFLLENIDLNSPEYKDKIKICYYIDNVFIVSCLPNEHKITLAKIRKKYPNKKITAQYRYIGNNKPVKELLSSIIKTSNNNFKTEANDEYYTQYSDIEREMSKISTQLKDKIVYCNCDDPKQSKFWEYFKNNFTNLHLRKLVSTYYTEGSKKSTAVVYDGKEEQNYEIDGDGDFRSKSCVNILQMSDVVITNPPFSLTKEFVPLILDNNKKFIILERQSKLSNETIFKYIKNGDIQIDFVGSMKFDRPNGNKETLNDMCWFTNIDNVATPKELNLFKTYNPKEYKKYDNFDAIDVSKISDIPKDYKGLIGVPTTIFSKYNPDKMELVKVLQAPYVNGTKQYKRIIIKLK